MLNWKKNQTNKGGKNFFFYGESFHEQWRKVKEELSEQRRKRKGGYSGKQCEKKFSIQLNINKGRKRNLRGEQKRTKGKTIKPKLKEY